MTILLFAAAIVGSGCVSETPPSHCGDGCPDPPSADPQEADAPPTAPATQEEAAPDSSAEQMPPSLAWESCTGSEVVVYAPVETVRPLVPPGFHVDQTATRATVFFQWVQCPRVVTLETVTSGSFLQVSVRVTPTNESWDDPGSPSFYVLSLAVSDEGIANATRLVGGQASLATLERATVPQQSGARLEQWTFESTDGSVATVFGDQGEPTGGSKQKVHYWHGDGPIPQRVDDLHEFLNDQLFIQPVVLRFEGDHDPYGALVPPDGLLEALAQPYHHTNHVWRVQTIEDRSGENP